MSEDEGINVNLNDAEIRFLLYQTYCSKYSDKFETGFICALTDKLLLAGKELANKEKETKS